MLDTCIFNHIADGIITKDDLPIGDFISTYIQVEEINNTKKKERRLRLLLCFIATAKELVHVETAVFEIARFGMAKFSDGKLYNKLKNELDAKNKSKKNNVQDCQIAETAIKNNLVLYTADKDLKEVAKNNGCEVKFFKA